MKKPTSFFLTGLIFFVFSIAYGQESEESTIYNAYYLAKNINNISPPSTDSQKTNAYYKNLYSSLLWYSTRIDTSEGAAAKRNKIITNKVLAIPYNQITINIIDTVVFIDRLKNYSSSDFKKYLSSLDIVQNEISAITSIQNDIHKLNNFIKYIELLNKDIINKQLIDLDSTENKPINCDTIYRKRGIFKYTTCSKKCDNYLTNKNKNISEYEFNSLKNDINSIDKIQKLDTCLFINFDIKEINTDSLKRVLKKKIDSAIISYKKNINQQNYKINYSSHDQETITSTTLKNIDLIYQNEPAFMRYPLAFKMPSEAETINAVTIYLTKRVKQETVMWFFDMLRINMTTDSVVRSLFPETILLLESGQIYEVPNLGASWQYALSKDLVQFPKNLINSGWTTNYCPQCDPYLPYLKFAWDISELVNQQYNFRDIITKLHMNYVIPDLSKKSNVLVNKNLSQLVSLLFSIQQECFIVAYNPEVKRSGYSRTLVYQDLLNMDDREFQTMMALIDMRYNVFSKLGIDYENKEKVYLCKQWLGKILLSMNQTQQLKRLMQGQSDDKIKYDNYNIWFFLQGLISNLLPPDALISNQNKEAIRELKHGLGFMGQAMEIYSQAEKKNFLGMISSNVRLLQSINDTLEKGKIIMPPKPDSTISYFDHLYSKIKLSNKLKKDSASVLYSGHISHNSIQYYAQLPNQKDLARLKVYPVKLGSRKISINNYKRAKKEEDIDKLKLIEVGSNQTEYKRILSFLKKDRLARLSINMELEQPENVYSIYMIEGKNKYFVSPTKKYSALSVELYGIKTTERTDSLVFKNIEIVFSDELNFIAKINSQKDTLIKKDQHSLSLKKDIITKTKLNQSKDNIYYLYSNKTQKNKYFISSTKIETKPSVVFPIKLSRRKVKLKTEKSDKPLFIDSTGLKKTGQTGTNDYLDNFSPSPGTVYSHLAQISQKKTITTITKLGAFISDVINAGGNSEQLADVVESYALPAGSYKRKRAMWHSLDVNAFVGVYAGSEYTYAPTKNDAVWGLSAPIGLSYSRTKGKRLNPFDLASNYPASASDPLLVKFKNRNAYYRSTSTFSFTLTVIDLGAPVSFLFNQGNSESLPQDVNFAQFISPGLHVGWGIPTTPLILQMGVQYTPQLRSYEEDVRQKDALRIYAGLFFDLPVFNIISREAISPKRID